MLTLEQIALKVKGKVVGDSSVQITSVDDITEASEGSITFSFLPKYQKKMSSSKASAFVSDSEKGLAGYNGIVVEQPYLAMITILTLFSKIKILNMLFILMLLFQNLLQLIQMLLLGLFLSLEIMLQ